MDQDSDSRSNQPTNGRSSTGRWVAALVATAVVAGAGGWFIADRSNPAPTGGAASDAVAAPDSGATDSGGATNPDTATPNEAGQPSWLFSATADGGTYVAGGDDTWTLTLNGLDPLITGFTDRPDRDMVTITPDGLVTAWPALFAESAPNAVLITRDADGTARTSVLELSGPTIDGTAISFSAALVEGADHSAQIPGMTPAPSVAPPPEFSTVSLFIDDASATGWWYCISPTLGVLPTPPPMPASDPKAASYANTCKKYAGVWTLVGTGANIPS